jgi:hypothetical protein
MDAKELSKWIWDVAKYVLSAIIITSFLGGFQDNKLMLYAMSFAVLSTLAAFGIYFNNRSKKKQS